jgi:hypothetical protein
MPSDCALILTSSISITTSSSDCSGEGLPGHDPGWMDTSSPLASHKSPTLTIGKAGRNLTRNAAVSLQSFHASLTPRARLLRWCLSACFAENGGISGYLSRLMPMPIRSRKSRSLYDGAGKSSNQRKALGHVE